VRTVILAGGLGTRLMEETSDRPKPMVEVGGRPLLWHIMQLYAAQGFHDFVVAAGHKGEAIKRYFLDYRLLDGDLHLDLGCGKVEVRQRCGEDWRVGVVDTGDETMTGGRLLRLAAGLQDGGTFMTTYGDGLADVDLCGLLEFHRRHGRIATLTAVRPPHRRQLEVIEGRVAGLDEAACAEEWVNGGFFVFEPGLFDYIRGDGETLEAGALTRLARAGELMAYRHAGFWQCMDTPREKELLERIWRSGEAPWLRRAGTRRTLERSYRQAGLEASPLRRTGWKEG
jgi:glucose-1-phosphate cytidylyltransferase